MAATKTDGGAQFTAKAYLIVPDPEQPSTWKVRVEETPGKVTVAQLGRAAAALTKGFRGNKVQASAEEIAAAKRKLRGLYRKMDAEPPEALAEMNLSEFTLAEISEVEQGDGQPLVLKNVPVILAGVSRNRRRYSAAVLQRDGPGCFEASPGFLCNHRAEAKDVTRLAGVWRNVRFDGAALRADFHASPEKTAEVRHALWAARELGGDRVGVSIDTHGSLRAERLESGMVHEVTSL